MKPDFVLICSDPRVPRVAIFCDGWAFHASPAVNRLADDARKRAALRAEGYVVVALTWQDLVAAEERMTSAPPWFSDRRWSQAVEASNGALRPGLRDLVTGGPVDLLVGWVSSPDPDGMRALAEHLPMLLIKAGPVGKMGLTEPLVARTLALHGGEGLASSGEKMAWSWQHDTLTVLARNTHGRATEIAALIDDRDDTLGQQHKLAWHDWLRLSNLLSLRLQEAHLTTYREASAARSVPRLDVRTPVDIAVELAGPWAEVVRQAVGAERSVLELLAGQGVKIPTLGHETPDGLPLSVSWPDHMVVVDLDLTDDDRVELAEAGWVVVPPEDAAGALERAGAQ